MARRVRVVETLIDDFDGTELPEGTGRSISFNWQGVDYEIDLSDEHGEALDAMMQPILDAARRVGGRKLPGKRQRAANAIGKGERAALTSGEPKEARADVTTGTGYAASMAKRRFLKEVRQWARDNGMDQGNQGRIKPEVRAAWDAAHPDNPVPEEGESEVTRRARVRAEQTAIENMHDTHPVV